MKRRLNLLCLLVMLVLSYSVFSTLYDFGRGVSAGLKMAKNIKADKAAKNDNPALHLKLAAFTPDNFTCFTDSVYNEKTSSYVPAMYSQLIVSVKTNPSMCTMLISGILSLLEFISIALSVVFFIRIIISINKSDIFNWKNVSRLRWLGAALTFSFTCSLVALIISHYELADAFALKGYSMHLSELLSITTLVLGIISFIIAEVFAIGLRLQEEQELTI